MTGDLPAALLSLGRLREVWPWLSESVVPGRSSWHERDLSPAAREELDRRAVTERAYKIWNARLGLKALAPSPAPASIGVLDARVDVLDALLELAWRVTESIRLRSWTGFGFRLVGWSDDERATAAMDFLSVMLPHCGDETVVRDGAVRLAAVDQLARRVVNAGEERRVVKADCPGCGRRSLYAEVGSDNEREWVIRCATACRCRGVDCGCKSTTRYPGRAHVWLRWEWEQFARLLGVVPGRLVADRAVQVEVDPTGAVWLDRESAARMLSRPGEDEVTVDMVRKWVQRKAIPTMRHRGRAYHPLAPLTEAEFEARATTDGRPRRVA